MAKKTSEIRSDIISARREIHRIEIQLETNQENDTHYLPLLGELRDNLKRYSDAVAQIPSDTEIKKAA